MLSIAVFGEILFFRRCILLVAYLFSCCIICNQKAVSMSLFKMCWPHIFQQRFHHITACAWNSTKSFMNWHIRGWASGVSWPFFHLLFLAHTCCITTTLLHFNLDFHTHSHCYSIHHSTATKIFCEITIWVASTTVLFILEN
jgi:hypothetical protein